MKLIGSRRRREWRESADRLRHSLTLFWKTQRVRARLSARTPVLVYQMGKVASMSVVASLERAAPACTVLHLHTLAPEKLGRRARAESRRYRRERRLPHHVVQGLYVRELLDAGRFPLPVRIVTLVREPMARAVSLFFDNLRSSHPDFPFRERLATTEPAALARELKPLFLETLPWHAAFPDLWLDTELKAQFGVDVFAGPASLRQGYAIVRSERAEALVIRLEDLDACAGAAFREFLGLEQFALVRANDAESKAYREVYRAFREETAFPAEALDAVYGTRFARWFYTPAEIETLRGRWRVEWTASS
jgi:hypothetical protein